MDEIERHYENVTFPSVRSEAQGYEDALKDGLHSFVLAQVELIGETANLGRNEFKISLTDFGYPPGWDYRCH